MVDTNKKRFFTFCHFVLNTILIVFSVYWVSYFFYSSRNFPFLQEFLILFIAAIQISLFLTGNYFSILKRIPLNQVAFNLFKSFILSILIASTYFFISKAPVAGRFVLYTLVVTYLVIVLAYFLIHWLVQFLRQHGRNQLYVLLVGNEEDVEKYLKHVSKNVIPGVHLMGFLMAPENKVSMGSKGLKCLGTTDDIRSVFRSIAVDEVVFLDPLNFPKVGLLVELCDRLGKKVRMLPTKNLLDVKKISVEEFAGEPTLVYSYRHSHDVTILLKNLFDLCFSSAFLLLGGPLFIIISFLIKLQSPGPIFFKQERVGLHGRRFRVYKFRTMVVNAEDLLTQLKEKNEGIGPGFKMKGDPRITPIGRWLRKFSLDELPQLFNVFRGEMSLVGPRPSLPNEVESHDFFQLKRLSMKPGLTCLWQVDSSRKAIDFHALVDKDLEYVERWSFLLDLVILSKTIKAVLSGTGY